jgi:hypothetical protein
MLTIPMVLGLGAGGWVAPAPWLIPPATVLVFLAHYALVPWAQRAREGKSMPPGYASRRLTWGTIYLVGSGAFFGAAVAVARDGARTPMLAIAAGAALLAAIYAGSAAFGSGRAIVAEILGLAGMSLTAPMMAAAAGRPMSRALFGPAALALSYFLSSVAFVRSYDGMKDERRSATLRCLAAHAVVAVGLIVAASVGVLPRFWWAALIPVALRTAWGLASPPSNLRALGMREIWVAVSFTALSTICLSLD